MIFASALSMGGGSCEVEKYDIKTESMRMNIKNKINLALFRGFCAASAMLVEPGSGGGRGDLHRPGGVTGGRVGGSNIAAPGASRWYSGVLLVANNLLGSNDLVRRESGSALCRLYDRWLDLCLLVDEISGLRRDLGDQRCACYHEIATVAGYINLLDNEGDACTDERMAPLLERWMALRTELSALCDRLDYIERRIAEERRRSKSAKAERNAVARAIVAIAETCT